MGDNSCTDSHDPNPDQPTTRRVFNVYRPHIMFTSDSGATNILVTHRDSSILINYTPFIHDFSRPGFSIADRSNIYSITTGHLTNGLYLQRRRTSQ